MHTGELINNEALELANFKAEIVGALSSLGNVKTHELTTFAQIEQAAGSKARTVRKKYPKIEGLEVDQFILEELGKMEDRFVKNYNLSGEEPEQVKLEVDTPEMVFNGYRISQRLEDARPERLSRGKPDTVQVSAKNQVTFAQLQQIESDLVKLFKENPNLAKSVENGDESVLAPVFSTITNFSGLSASPLRLGDQFASVAVSPRYGVVMSALYEVKITGDQ